MTFSLGWSGKHTDYSPEGVDHTPGNGSDLEDRVVVAVKHAVGQVLRALGPDATPRDVTVSASGQAPVGDDPAGTNVTLSISVPPEVSPPVPLLADAPQASPAPEAPDATAAASEAATDAGGEASQGVPPDSAPADPAGDPATGEAAPTESSPSATTPAEPDTAPQE